MVKTLIFHPDFCANIFSLEFEIDTVSRFKISYTIIISFNKRNINVVFIRSHCGLINKKLIIMNVLKYVIDEKNIPIIFSKEKIHNTVVQKANSGGFLIIKYNKILNKFSAICFGESTSLKVKSSYEDKILIENYLNNHFLTFKN